MEHNVYLYIAVVALVAASGCVVVFLVELLL